MSLSFGEGLRWSNHRVQRYSQEFANGSELSEGDVQSQRGAIAHGILCGTLYYLIRGALRGGSLALRTLNACTRTLGWVISGGNLPLCSSKEVKRIWTLAGCSFVRIPIAAGQCLANLVGTFLSWINDRSCWQAGVTLLHKTSRIDRFFDRYELEVADETRKYRDIYYEGNLARYLLAEAQTFHVDPDSLLMVEGGRPARHHEILSQFGALIEDSRGRFPTIHYLNSPGQDRGGLTRDLITRIFDGICHPNQDCLSLERGSTGLYIPNIIQETTGRPNLLEERRQIECYRAMGAIFARILSVETQTDSSHRITIGNRFSPVVFQMIHALTTEDLERLTDPDIRTIPNEIYKKLVKIYVRSEFPTYFPSPEQEFNAAFERFFGGVITPELAAMGVDQYFVRDYVHGKIRAALMIAKSMHEHLDVPMSWDAMKGQNAVALGNKIEGVFTRDAVLAALPEGESGAHGFLRRWARAASLEELKEFVWAISGSSTLTPGQKLSLNVCDSMTSQHLPVFHTCFFSMDVPRYNDYPTFKERLEGSITNSRRSITGFEVA